MILFIILLTISFVIESKEDVILQRAAAKGEAGNGNRLFKVPKVFEFWRFKEIFDKTYPSYIQELARAQIYLTKAFRAFISSKKYFFGLASKYLRINHMSDWTTKEAEQLNGVIAGSDFRLRHKSNDNADNEDDIGTVDKLAKVASLLEIEESLDELEVEIEKLDMPKELIEKQVSNKERAIVLRGNQNDLMQKIIHEAGSKRGPKPKRHDDVLFVDHRRSGCITKVKSQASCGACYVFSTIALYEYLYCKDTGELLDLSEQYVIDCGTLVGLKGCKGSEEYLVTHFVDRFGFELEEDYPYQARSGQCPYSSSVDPSKLGYLRVDDQGLMHVSRSNFDPLIEETPFVISIYTGKDFQDYGGGVDKLTDCSSERAHSMLVVGHGREDDEDYWLIKNSFSHFWGENGYYKLTKRISRWCFIYAGVSASDFTLRRKVKNEFHRRIRLESQ